MSEWHERMDWYMRQACIRWIDKWRVTDWKDIFIGYGRVSDMNAWMTEWEDKSTKPQTARNCTPPGTGAMSNGQVYTETIQ